MDPTATFDSGQARVNDSHHPENYLLEDGEEPTADWQPRSSSVWIQHATSTNTVMAVTVVTMSSIAPGAPESIRENV
jgi:hypothetical protein